MWETLEERDLLYSLVCLPGIGRQTIRAIYEYWGSFHAFAADWSGGKDMPMLPGKQAERILREQWTFRKVLQDKSARTESFFTMWDPEYPALFRHIPDPPLLLFYRGEVSLLQQPMVAVVGSRRPTPYGKSACAQLVGDMVTAGITIVSGLALGIDAEAHRTALRLGGNTIAVLGCGIDQVYPAIHRPLYRQIAEQGLILSEYPPGTAPRQGLFPERNRLISGLAQGVLVVEAAERSGSLITADFALEQGREVFAVPGPIFSPLSRGPHNLIKQGAKLVTGWEEIREELFPLLGMSARMEPMPMSPGLSASDAASKVLDRIAYEPVHWDELYASLCGVERQRLDQELLQLEIRGLICSLPGGYYVRQR